MKYDISKIVKTMYRRKEDMNNNNIIITIQNPEKSVNGVQFQQVKL